MLFGSAISSARWSRKMVSMLATPGATAFGPPEKPAKKCGSINPRAMRTSALRYSRFKNTVVPFAVLPTCSFCVSLNASWLTMRTRRTISSPNISTISRFVFGLCVPVPINTVTWSGDTGSSSSSHRGSVVCWGRDGCRRMLRLRPGLKVWLFL